jgi:hypothetical protein
MRLHLVIYSIIISTATGVSAFVQWQCGDYVSCKSASSSSSSTMALHARTPVGPMARLKKLQDPKEYNRVVEEKMKRSKMTREEAEADYNQFLENPPFYYALEKKVRCYNIHNICTVVSLSLQRLNNLMYIFLRRILQINGIQGYF